jgi:hypothetical protein
VTLDGIEDPHAYPQALGTALAARRVPVFGVMECSTEMIEIRLLHGAETLVCSRRPLIHSRNL